VSDQDIKLINELMNSWAVQAILALLLIGLLVVAFTRASRTFADDRTRRAFRIAVVGLGVLAVVQAVLTAALGHIPYPPVQLIELLWLFALWLYWFLRFMTRQRSGPGDPEAQRRGVALEGTISRMEDERRGGAGGAADGTPVPR
jgi:peptidoglycan biosynthesis protein MviN/MurJ (putative lipid II flippase)